MERADMNPHGAIEGGSVADPVTTTEPTGTDEQRFQAGANEVLEQMGLVKPPEPTSNGAAAPAPKADGAQASTEPTPETGKEAEPEKDGAEAQPASDDKTKPAGDAAQPDKPGKGKEAKLAEGDGETPGAEGKGKAEGDKAPKKGKALYREDDGVEQLRHKLKTVDGMYRSQSEKIQELEKKLAEKAPSTPAAPAQPAAVAPETPAAPPSDATLTEVVRTAIQSMPKFKAFKAAYGETMPEIADAIEEGLLAVYFGSKADADQRLSAMQAELTALKAQSETMAHDYKTVNDQYHFESIHQAHPDLMVKDEATGTWSSPYEQELGDWVNSLPTYKRDAYTQVLDEGSAEDVIDLMNEFKSVMRYTAPPAVAATPAAPKAEPAPPIRVSSRPTPVSPEARGKTEEERYQEGVKEALAQL